MQGTPANAQRSLRGSGLPNSSHEQEVDLLRDQNLGHPQLLLGIALGARDNRTHAAAAGFGLEAFRQLHEEMVAVMRQDHAADARARQAKPARLQIDGIAEFVRQIEHSSGGLRLDSVFLPSPV
jgi:hypothetical protein